MSRDELKIIEGLIKNAVSLENAHVAYHEIDTAYSLHHPLEHLDDVGFFCDVA